MKLFVYCPGQYYEQNCPQWEKAINLSKQSKLPIVTNIEDFIHLDSPSVVSIPDQKYSNVDESVKSGFVHRIDITDEFCDFSPDVIAEFTSPDGSIYQEKPILKELHRVQFRTRHLNKGKYRFAVRLNNLNYMEGCFTVV